MTDLDADITSFATECEEQIKAGKEVVLTALDVRMFREWAVRVRELEREWSADVESYERIRYDLLEKIEKLGKDQNG